MLIGILVITMTTYWASCPAPAPIDQAACLHNLQISIQIKTAKKMYLISHMHSIEVTAYALTPDFGNDPLFANTQRAKAAFAVPAHTLPTDVTLCVALSPIAEKQLHARLNDSIILINKRTEEIVKAKFVDRTSQSNPLVATKAVVDVYFRSAHQAKIFGRHFDYVAVNSTHVPFLKN